MVTHFSNCAWPCNWPKRSVKGWEILDNNYTEHSFILWLPHTLFWPAEVNVQNYVHGRRLHISSASVSWTIIGYPEMQFYGFVWNVLESSCNFCMNQLPNNIIDLYCRDFQRTCHHSRPYRTSVTCWRALASSWQPSSVYVHVFVNASTADVQWFSYFRVVQQPVMYLHLHTRLWHRH